MRHFYTAEGTNHRRKIQDERGSMRPQRVVGLACCCHQIGPRWLHARVNVLSVITVGPSIKFPMMYGSHIIGYQVATDFIPLVHGDPQLSGLRLPGHADWIAQTAGINVATSADDIDFPDRRPAGFLLQSVFADVAVRSNTDV